MAYTTIDDPSVYFHTQLYTGNNNTNQSITNNAPSGNFKADWLWIKNRDDVEQHHLMDSSRGANKFLFSNATNAERTGSHGAGHNNINAFDSNGFSFTSTGSGDELNFGTRAYVAWQWKCNGGTTASNSDGSITSTVQANTTAGFSIVLYTGNGSNSTVGHGLGATPKVVIVKRRTGSIFFWAVQHASIFDSNDTVLALDTTDAAFNQSGGNFNGTNPTSSVFTIGSGGNTNGNSETHVAYCFAEKKGFSKFGSYVGNSSADGTFIHTGFKPAWVMTRQHNGGNHWHIKDNKVNPHNVRTTHLKADTNAVEETPGGGENNMDFLSNGFKFRNSDHNNQSSGQYVYFAFAEHPFVSSGGIPSTAE